MSWALVFTVGHHLLSTLLNLFWPHVVAFMQKARFVSRSNFHLKQCRLASHNAESQIIAKFSLTLSIDGVALYSLVVCSFVRPSAWWHHHLSPPYDVLDHTNHIFSESLSSDWPRGRLREGFKNPSHGICPLGGYLPPLLNGRENLAKKVNGKGGYPPSPHSGQFFF